MSDYSSFLFARPSFWEGAARAFDIGGTLDEYNRSVTGNSADARAICADWHAIGGDLEAAIENVRRQLAGSPREVV